MYYLRNCHNIQECIQASTPQEMGLVESYIRAHPDSVNYKLPSEQTPLSVAYSRGLVNVVELLLKNGAVPKDGLGGPVGYLNSLGLSVCMDMLLLLMKYGHGSNIEKNADALYKLSTEKIDKLDDKICIFRFLAEQGFSRDETYFGASLLQQTLHLFPEGFKVLIEKGVDVSDIFTGPLLPYCTHRLQDAEILGHITRAFEIKNKRDSVVKNAFM